MELSGSHLLPRHSGARGGRGRAARFWVSAGGASTHANVSRPTAGYSSVQSAVTAAQTYESSHPGVA